MFSRRYLRRSFIAVLTVPIVLLGLFLIYQHRSTLVQDHALHQYHHDDHHDHHDHGHQNQDDSHLSHKPIQKSDTENLYNTKILTTTGYITSKSNVPYKEQMKNTSKSSQLLFQQQIFNKDQPMPIINSIQSDFLFQRQTRPLNVINTKNLERFVHLDLKGAAPKVNYYEQLFPYLRELGANGILIEYEDMFPFTDNLSIIRHDFAYSKMDIENILKLAEQNNLKVMPLLQVYGHLEYVLKLKEFMHLREDKRYPQVITPCLEESYKLLYAMIDQLLLQHPSIPYLHIGCDEVYYRLVHPQCANLNFRDEADLFIRHVTRIAKYIKSKRRQIKIFIWHDMISQLLSSDYNNATELVELVVPMIWAYVDDVKPWFDDTFWMRFGTFHEVWIASSFKGSSGEITTFSYIGHHQRNQQTWLEAMHIASDRYKVNFTGVAVTGWSRYDHMLSLCEFLPSSIPSLAYTLQTIEYGRLNDELNQTISKKFLGCSQIPLWERPKYATFIPCKFPGHEMYEMMCEYDNVMRQYEETMAFVRLYITDIHLRQNYIHYKRTEECFDRLITLESQMIRFIDAFQNTCLLFFTPDIGSEWLQTYFMRTFKEIQLRVNFVERTLKAQTSWLQRPLPKNMTRIIVKKRNFTFKNFEKNSQ